MNIATIRLMSRVLFMPTDVTVLLPEEILEEKYPVLWLLHGAQGDHRSYLYSVDLEGMVAKHKVIIVMPSALNSDYSDFEEFGTGYNFASYFFDELMPFIYSTFPASPEREDNYLEGASMGGFGAASLGLAHPEWFAALGIMGASMRESEFLVPYAGGPSSVFRKDALANPKAFPTEYGAPESGIKLKEVNVITKYPTIQAFYNSPDCMWRRLPEAAQKGTLPQMYVACGTKDLFYPATKRLEERVKELGLEEKFHFVTPEGIAHDGGFFDVQLAAFLDYYDV